METSPAIAATGLAKRYGDLTVLDGVDLEVARGTVFALLGPNGAGKTTTVRILTTLTAADAGTARVAGHDVATERSKVRRAISLTGQFAAVDQKQTGAENLRMMARLRGLSRPAAARSTAALLERFDLTRAAGRLTDTYSGGMRRRLDLAASLVGDPEVVFLDEPTTGLDPRSRAELWTVVRELSAGGTTVFLTTQYLEEADRLAHRIALVDGGRIVADGTAQQLKARVGGHRLELALADAAAFVRTAHRLPAHEGAPAHQSPQDLTISLPTDGTAESVRALLDLADPDRTDVVRFALHEATLDDVFFALTGAEARTDTSTNTDTGADKSARPNSPRGKEPSHV